MCLNNLLTDLSADPAEVARRYAKHGSQVLQGDLLQKMWLFSEHFGIPFFATKHDQIMAAGINATDGVL